MYLKSLEINGFKSFAKKANLTFSTPITGIVGPNGSGKSNTAEAFRFVLGEQSLKSMRGKRGEDMIWNGGGETGRANRANVKLTFDNSRRMFPSIDFDEVTLERVVHRDNSNEYLLNGSQVRLKDIAELLSSAHIGASGHHIISQGEADRILSASIRERREIIEDALGLKIYQWKKLESLRKLERTEENMKQVESLRREIAPHLRFLKKQVEKVEKAEELRRELISLYREYFSCEENYLRIETTKVAEELCGPKEEMAELDKALAAAKKILTDSKTADRKSGEIISIEEKLKIVRSEKDGIVHESGRLDGELGAAKRAIEKEEIRIKSEASKTVYLRDVEDVVKKVESFKEMTDVRQLWDEVMSVLRGFISRHKTAVDSAFMEELKVEVSELTEKRKKLEADLRDISEQEVRLMREYNELKNAIEKEKDTNRDAEKEVFRIIARQNEVRNVISKIVARQEELKREEEAFKQELGQAAIIAGREAVEYSKAGNSVAGEENPSSVPLANSAHYGGIFLSGDVRALQNERRHKIERNKIRLEDSGGAGGAEVLKECRETEERDAFLARELEDLEKAKGELLKLITDLDVRIDYEFKSGILKINTEFQKYFTLMFGGGRAELTVVREAKRRKKSDTEELGEVLSGVDSSEMDVGLENEAENEGPEGIDVDVSLPRKKVKGLMMLSGGERALTSIALIFAVSQVNPPPFIILDETDAALDEANSKKYGDMIENLSERSQLILITHNRETMSRAGVLYGVTMGSDGASKLLSIAFEEAVAVAK